ncbi:helix-turn-helix transcriptional regulator [Cohnella algarum]|uniref:helix-turn-helix transcriptional regulator n=1 Tax=Cohnella algarum TaxID=2044859 RepID=UPI0019673B98|nr:helix-turn-helix domain-containing protein [Cohnella algarum]MBN2984376.1 helix-turn-helix domain-containing protein [Cohnella algarum]
MTYPINLRENTVLPDKSYPVNFFANRPLAGAGQGVLYLHWHEHIEIIVMKKGSALFLIDSLPFEADAGDALVVPSGSLHVGYNRSDLPVEYVSIVASPALFGDSARDPVFEAFVKPFLEGQISFPMKLDGLDPENARLIALLDDAIAEFKSKRLAYQLVVKNDLLLVFALLSRSLLPAAPARNAAEPTFRNRDRFKSLLARMESNPSGRTFIDYSNLLRMNEALRLLRQSDLTVTEIAESIGCGNPNYFTKLFKQYFGHTPSQARKQELP